MGAIFCIGSSVRWLTIRLPVQKKQSIGNDVNRNSQATNLTIEQYDIAHGTIIITNVDIYITTYNVRRLHSQISNRAANPSSFIQLVFGAVSSSID